MITLQWKDPDTDVLHIIMQQGSKNEMEEVRLKMSPGGVTQRFVRAVSMRCGISFQVDSDDYILPPTNDNKISLILRPWLTTRDAPTCMTCIAAPVYASAWDGSIRGA